MKIINDEEFSELEKMSRLKFDAAEKEQATCDINTICSTLHVLDDVEL